MRSTDGLEVGGSNPASAARLAESKGLETAPYLYLALGTSVCFGTISVMHANNGCMTPRCSEKGTGKNNYYYYYY